MYPTFARMENQKNLFGLGVLLGILGVVLFSAKAVMVKLAYAYEVDSLTLLLLRMGFALPFYVVIALAQGRVQHSEVRPKDYLWVVFFGCIGYYLASLFDFIGLQYLKAGLERIILFIYPTIVVLLSWWFFKKRLQRVQGIAILITYVGVVVTFWDEIGISGSETYWGAFLIVLSAIAYASYLVGSGWLIPKLGVLRFTSYAMIVSTLCVVVHYISVGGTGITGYAPQVYAYGAALALFSTVLPSFLVSEAIKRLGASNFSILGSLGPVSTIILAYLFLDERLSWLQIMGILIVISGVTYLSLRTKRAK